MTGASPGLARYGLEWATAGARRIVKQRTRTNQCSMELCISSRVRCSPNTSMDFNIEQTISPQGMSTTKRGVCLQTRIDGTKNDSDPRDLLYIARMRFESVKVEETTHAHLVQ